MPLRYGVAVRLIMAWGINPSWLASGQGRQTLRMPVSLFDDILADERQLFTAVFHDQLKIVSEQWESKIASDPKTKYGCWDGATDPVARFAAAELLVSDIREWFVSVPDSQFNALFNAIYHAGMAFVEDSPVADAKAVIDERRAAFNRIRPQWVNRRAMLAEALARSRKK